MEILEPDSIAPPAGNYSHGVVSGGFVFVAGTVGTLPDQTMPGDGGIEAQTRQAIDNVIAILAAANTTLNNIVSATVYLSDMADYKGFSTAWAAKFGGHRPARATVRADMVHPALKVEIQAIAAVESA